MIHIYTDGSCNGNPGDGGWAALIVEEDGHLEVLSGREGKTTNNRMEQMAALKALERLSSKAEATIYSDSQYVVKTMTRGWKRNANLDLWTILDQLVKTRQVNWEWVKGHAGHPENEFANALAGYEAGVHSTKPHIEEFLRDAATQPVAPADLDVEKRGWARARPGLTHLDEQGQARMVDVGWKEETEREAVATGRVVMAPETLALIEKGGLEKGDVLATARLAGIMGAKQTPTLIPLCHPIPLTQVTVAFEVDRAQSIIQITATAQANARTGVEMEALTAVTVAALTIYDMGKASDRGMRIEDVRLLRKRGGKSGEINLE